MKQSNPFETFFRDPVYLDLKNHLYNYQRRRDEILRFTDARSGTIVEVGSGISPIIPAERQPIYSDTSEEAMRHLKAATGVPVLVSSATEIALANECVSMVVCSEVIEHIKDDHAALREMARILGPRGELILTVPAHPYYFSSDDRFVQHWRRYKITELVKTLSDIGFENFDVVKVAGPLEKITMIFAISLFRVVRPVLGAAGKKSKLPPVLKLLLPLYKKANGLYCLLIKAEASIIPLSLATIVLIRCRKSSNL